MNTKGNIVNFKLPKLPSTHERPMTISGKQQYYIHGLLITLSNRSITLEAYQ